MQEVHVATPCFDIEKKRRATVRREETSVSFVGQ